MQDDIGMSESLFNFLEMERAMTRACIPTLMGELAAANAAIQSSLDTDLELGDFLD